MFLPSQRSLMHIAHMYDLLSLRGQFARNFHTSNGINKKKKVKPLTHLISINFSVIVDKIGLFLYLKKIETRNSNIKSCLKIATDKKPNALSSPYTCVLQHGIYNQATTASFYNEYIIR